MIARSEYGPRCPHCGHINPAAAIEVGDVAVPAPIGSPTIDCIHCRRTFTFWLERLPFYCTDDGRTSRGCDCAVCQPKPADPAT